MLCLVKSQGDMCPKFLEANGWMSIRLAGLVFQERIVGRYGLEEVFLGWSSGGECAR